MNNKQDRVDFPCTPPRTPPMVPTQFGLFSQQSAEECVFGYRLFYPDSLLSKSPIRLANRGFYDFLIFQGLPSVEVLHNLVQRIYPAGWPQQAEQGESDFFQEVSPGRYFLDERGLPQIKFRVVLTKEGELMLSLNGNGSSFIPFHHQMAISRSMIVDGVVDYALHLKNSLQPVLFAGEFLMGSDGKVYGITNRSGHYKPPVAALEVMLDWLSLRSNCLAEIILVEANTKESSIRESILKHVIQWRSILLTHAGYAFLSKHESAELRVTSERTMRTSWN